MFQIENKSVSSKMVYVLALLLVGGSLYMVSTHMTNYVDIPPSMSMEDFNKYVSFIFTVSNNVSKPKPYFENS